MNKSESDRKCFSELTQQAKEKQDQKAIITTT